MVTILLKLYGCALKYFISQTSIIWLTHWITRQTSLCFSNRQLHAWWPCTVFTIDDHTSLTSWHGADRIILQEQSINKHNDRGNLHGASHVTTRTSKNRLSKEEHVFCEAQGKYITAHSIMNVVINTRSRAA